MSSRSEKWAAIRRRHCAYGSFAVPGTSYDYLQMKLDNASWMQTERGLKIEGAGVLSDGQMKFREYTPEPEHRGDL